MSGRGPTHLRTDNGPEFSSAAVKRWCEESGTRPLSIDSASPWQNGIVELFNGRLRDELLSSEIFEMLAEARYLWSGARFPRTLIWESGTQCPA